LESHWRLPFTLIA